jgi:ornithine cyclodeaminase/alanine dehydrogenase
MISKTTLLLNRTQITRLVTFRDYFDAVQSAFKLHGEGRIGNQGLLHVDTERGEFHIKAGALNLDQLYFAVKINGGFYENTKRYGLPNILGIIVLCDGSTGFPLAMMDSSEITRQRTAAAAAVAAKHLARPDSKTITICGCGAQGHTQLSAMVHFFPVVKAFAYDIELDRSRQFAQNMSQELGISIEAVDNLGAAVRESDICITCTSSKRYFVKTSDVKPGTFIAAMGADSPDKQELEPTLLSRSKVVVDVLTQCERVGELHHAIEEQVLSRNDIYAELGEIVAGKKQGRTSQSEITIFDSTGTAIQDVAAAAIVYAKALANDAGVEFSFLA